MRIALLLKGLDPSREYVPLRDNAQRAPEYLEVNPQGLVPALIDDEGQVHTQSLAIIEYLDERWPDPPLLPGSPGGRSRVRSLALAVACDLHPLNNLRILRHLAATFGADEETIARDWYRHWVDVEFAALDRRLADDPQTGAFCHGDGPTLADCCLVPQVFNAQRFGVDMGQYPAIGRIFDTCMSLPSFDAAQPSKQPDATD